MFSHYTIQAHNKLQLDCSHYTKGNEHSEPPKRNSIAISGKKLLISIYHTVSPVSAPGCVRFPVCKKKDAPTYGHAGGLEDTVSFIVHLAQELKCCIRI